MIKLIKRMICAYSGHDLNDDMKFRCYIRDGRRFKHNGRLFRCRRCGVLVYIRGIQNKELADLIKATLKDLPDLKMAIYQQYLGVNKS